MNPIVNVPDYFNAQFENGCITFSRWKWKYFLLKSTTTHVAMDAPEVRVISTRVVTAVLVVSILHNNSCRILLYALGLVEPSAWWFFTSSSDSRRTAQSLSRGKLWAWNVCGLSENKFVLLSLCPQSTSSLGFNGPEVVTLYRLPMILAASWVVLCH